MEVKNTTPEEEVNNTEFESEESQNESNNNISEEAPKTKTVQELIGDEEKPQTVPLKTFLETKKDLKKEIAELKTQLENGASKKEINLDLEKIAEKYDVDPKFLEELSSVIYAKAKGETEEKLNSELRPLKEKERADKIEKVFGEQFDMAMETLPELKSVVNRSVIKELSLLPQNGNKTFQQIIEETYGNVVTGKKTMESSTPRGGKDFDLDMTKVNDPEYFNQIMANPELKKKYNENIQNRINL